MTNPPERPNVELAELLRENRELRDRYDDALRIAHKSYGLVSRQRIP